jgi:transcriptional/translational regulatory protein YebC/TACO1
MTVPLSSGKAVEEVTRLLDILEEHDDVKDVHSNAEFPE